MCHPMWPLGSSVTCNFIFASVDPHMVLQPPDIESQDNTRQDYNVQSYRDFVNKMSKGHSLQTVPPYHTFKTLKH
jgi:hypothetical protein